MAKRIAISGIIGWDATPAQLREDLRAANGSDVELVISSPGGLVGEGLEMFNLIRNYPGGTTAILSGYAMSMASYLPLACGRVVAEDNAIYMIHNARGGVIGDHNDVNKYGQYLQGISVLVAQAYAKRSGKELGEIQQMMDQETYFFGSDIVDHGFADEMIQTETEPSQQTATAMAMAAMEQLTAKLAAESARVKDDMSRAMAMVRMDPPPTQKKGETTMDLKQLKEKHPELVAAIADETKATMAATIDQAKNEGRTLGAEQERKRIADVRAQAIPGHEELVEQMAMDGKSTAADTALAIVNAEKALRGLAVKALGDEAPPVVPPATPPAPNAQTMTRAQFDAQPPRQKADFVKDGGVVKD